MKLRSLTLSNVRKFAGQTARISGISDGVTVVSEANEFGKSTFFDALHALFFLKYGAGTREVKSLQPPSGGAVRISAEVELAKGRFVIEKSFLAKKRAIVRDTAGVTVALDDEAERWIAQLMENGLEGPAGLLWVRQGTTALEPEGNSGADRSEKERLLGARRSLLSSVAGEIDMVTGGRRMDRVIETAREALKRLATPTGVPKAHGPWKDAMQEVETYSARHAELDRACTELSQALGRRRDVLARLAVLEQPAQQLALEQALTQAQARFDAAMAYRDTLAQADNRVELRSLEHEGAQRKLDGLIASEQRRDETEKRLQQVADQLAQSSADVKSLAAQKLAAEQVLAGCTADLKAATAAKEAAQHAMLLDKAKQDVARLEAAQKLLVEKRDALEAATTAVASMPVTPEVLAGIEKAEAARQQAHRDVAVGVVSLNLEYTGTHKLRRDQAEVAAGSHHITHKQSFELPGIGRMTLDPGAAAKDMQAVRATDEQFADKLAQVGLADLATVRQAAVARKDVVDEIAMLRGLVQVLAPDGPEAVFAAHAQAKSALAALCAQRTREDQVPPQAEVQTIEAAQDAQTLATEAFERSRSKHADAVTQRARIETEHAGAQAEFDAAKAAFGEADQFDTRKAEAARAVSIADVALSDAQRDASELKASAPDLDTAKADLARARSALENVRAERSDLQAQSAALSATIRTRADDGVEERRDEAAGLLRAARDREARFAHEAAALRLLVEALSAKRGAAQEAYFGPVQQELAPLLKLLHADAALSFDPASLLPDRMERDGKDETIEMLSGGTREQIAILTRLAFARLFAKQGKPMPVILDDALVYSDDTRITAMFTALHRVADDQQVIVFSCRQMAFAGLGGVRPKVEITADL